MKSVQIFRSYYFMIIFVCNAVLEQINNLKYQSLHFTIFGKILKAIYIENFDACVGDQKIKIIEKCFYQI